MFFNSSQQALISQSKPPKQQHPLAKSSLMNNILCGGDGSGLNSHYIDTFQRFKKDYAAFDKQARQINRQKKQRILEEKKNQQIERETFRRKNQFEYDQKNLQKINQSRYLCSIGLKATGFTNGLPMNPITLKYHQNQFGYQYKFNQEQQKLKKIVRTHYIQNVSTCGYNLINGNHLPALDPLIPKNTEGRLQQKLGKFYEPRRLNPNVDLGLNPKQFLPKNVGEVDKTNQSPIKTQKWNLDEQQNFQTSYKAHFNEQPHNIIKKSRMQQSKIYREQMQAPCNIQKLYNLPAFRDQPSSSTACKIKRLSTGFYQSESQSHKQSRIKIFNENISPIMFNDKPKLIL